MPHTALLRVHFPLSFLIGLRISELIDRQGFLLFCRVFWLGWEFVTCMVHVDLCSQSINSQNYFTRIPETDMQTIHRTKHTVVYIFCSFLSILIIFTSLLPSFVQTKKYSLGNNIASFLIYRTQRIQRAAVQASFTLVTHATCLYVTNTGQSCRNRISVQCPPLSCRLRRQNWFHAHSNASLLRPPILAQISDTYRYVFRAHLFFGNGSDLCNSFHMDYKRPGFLSIISGFRRGLG